DPDAQGGVRLNQGAPENEISDGIFNGSTLVDPISQLAYRLPDGNLVQPYWSQNDHADIIPDGLTQRFLVTPDTSTTFETTFYNSTGGFYAGTLTVNGDQMS